MYFYRRFPQGELRKPKKIPFWTVYIIAVIFNFHTLLVSYTTPTYLEKYITASQIGLLYAVGSFGSLLFFLILPIILKRLGNLLAAITLMAISIITLTLAGTAFTPALVIVGLLIFLMINPLLYLNIDIFSETLIGKNEGATGRVRGLTLSLMSIAALLAPITISLTIGDGDNLSQLYFIGIGIGATFILVLLALFRPFVDPVYHKIHLRPLIKQCLQTKAIRLVLTTHFILQIFFTWTVLYIPLYFASELNLPWSSIGAIIAAGLVAYTLFEYPVGILADNYWGEKEMMAFGFLIIALTVSSLSFITSASIALLMSIMFISRIGAAMVEVTTESYFFKKVDGGDANLMSVFRLMRPLAVLSASLLGSISLAFMPFHLTFLVLAFVMVLGMLVTLSIVDTR